ncbi:Hypothetical_protein [Hexamita inflata]|uniref:Hypothetical_protein n=1 Tax=Hexamita inflata TaxID=28002 RepID=A0AA86RG26_9EUKA|nr:Hypothetical protein HINF_LOCUS59244 [Hexamita inflata]
MCCLMQRELWVLLKPQSFGRFLQLHQYNIKTCLFNCCCNIQIEEDEQVKTCIIIICNIGVNYFTYNSNHISFDFAVIYISALSFGTSQKHPLNNQLHKSQEQQLLIMFTLCLLKQWQKVILIDQLLLNIFEQLRLKAVQQEARTLKYKSLLKKAESDFVLDEAELKFMKQALVDHQKIIAKFEQVQINEL